MSKPRVSLDSCAILHLLSGTSPWLSHLKSIYDDARFNRLEIVVSEVSVAECQRLQPAGGATISPEEASQKIADFFRHRFILRRGITSRESGLANRLIVSHGIGTCDALIAATAVYADAQVLFTSDGCTHRRKAGKLLSVDSVSTDCGKQMVVQCPDKYKLDSLS